MIRPPPRSTRPDTPFPCTPLVRSYWIMQTIPLAAGGRTVSVSGRNGILNSLRSSKGQGQSNFNNPGLILTGAGADFDLTPQLRVSANANHMWFETPATLATLRN